jgi:hypothetical protein
MIAEHRRRNVYREWDIARTLGVWTVSPYSKKKLKPSDLLKLEDNKPVKPSTPEQFQQALKKYGFS